MSPSKISYLLGSTLGLRCPAKPKPIMESLDTRLTLKPTCLAAFAYVLAACALTWPLPAYINTHFTGSPGGDLGVYVWNLWIFAHELTEHARLPFSTDHVFAYTDGADFALHNYTPIVGLLGTPLLRWLGIVATFNVLLLVALVTAGLSVFVLARRVGLSPRWAWLAGALFMMSPVMTARETAHISLVWAAALPLFAATLMRTLEAPRRRDALWIGGLVACATYSDAYYGVYCVLMGLFLVAWRFVRVALQRPPTRVPRALDVVLALLLAVIAWRVAHGELSFRIGPLQVEMQTLYNLVLLATLVLGLRIWWAWRPRVGLDDPAGLLPRLTTIGFASVGVTVALLTPVLVGILLRAVDGRLPLTPVYWRSSPRGVDLLAYVIPGPAHPLLSPVTGSWFMPPQGDAFPEFVAAFPIAAWVLVFVAWWRGRLPTMWLAFTGLFMSLSLGPFVHVAGINTTLVTPWTLLRYVPIIGQARSPSRFVVLATLGLSILTAFALRELVSTSTVRRRAVLALSAVLAIELLPLPRPLFSAAVPQVYQLIAASGDEQGRVLELPTGVRDGTSSLGDFSAASQFFQTRHHRPLIGGYLSRVSEWRKRESRRPPILRALHQLSEPGGSISDSWREEAYASRVAFLARSCIRYVVVHRGKASAELRTFAVDALGLISIHRDENEELLIPDNPPPCSPRPAHRWLLRNLRGRSTRPAVATAADAP